MAFYNVNKIENWYDDFTSCKNKFINTYYDDYQDSYIRSCSDDIIRKMKNQLNSHYDKIKRIYERINTHWGNYLNDLKNIDNCMAGTVKSSSVNASSPAAKLNALPYLKEYEAGLVTKIESFSGSIGTVTFLGWSEDNDAAGNLLYIFERTGATIGTAVVSVIEGIGMFGEGIVDVCTTVVSECYCQVRLVFDKNFTEEQADIIRESTRDVVATQYVKDKFDSFYQESDVGAYLSKNTYAFDAVRSIGNEVGIVAGAVVVSTLTQGAIPASVLYGVAKAGNHIEENFQDESKGYYESILKGGAEGVLDGLFFAAGAKGDQALKAVIGQSTVKNALAFGGKMGYEAACSLAQDGSGIVLDSLFMDNQIIDNNGNTIHFENYKDKLSYCYEQAGGKEAMLESLTTAVVLSGLSDGVDTIKAVRNIDAGSAIKNIDVSSSSIDTNASGISKQIDEVTSKTSAFDESNIVALNNRIAKDNFVGIKVDSEADIPDDIWERISRPKNDKDVWITTADGKKYYWGEDVHPRMLEGNGVKNSSLSKEVEILESDSGRNTTEYKFNSKLFSSNSIEKLSVSPEKIKQYENAFGLDYSNNYDKKIIDGVEYLILKNNFSDDNVAKIVKNIVSISSIDKSFSIVTDSSMGSMFFGPGHYINLSPNLLEQSTGVISQTSLHEMGHAYFHVFNGDPNSFFKLNLTEKTKNIMEESSKNLKENPNIYIKYLKTSNDVYDNAISETIKWYDRIRPSENARIEALIDDLYSNKNLDGLTQIVSDASKMSQVRDTLAQAGMDASKIDDILTDKELVKQIAIKQNNINNQQAYLDNLMGSYDIHGDYRKLSSIINSITQKVEHIDPITGNKISCTYCHSDSYWYKSGSEGAIRLSYDELCADYFSLAAHGRNDVISAMEEILGVDLMNSIRGEFKNIADILESKGLIIN